MEDVVPTCLCGELYIADKFQKSFEESALVLKATVETRTQLAVKLFGLSLQGLLMSCLSNLSFSDTEFYSGFQKWCFDWGVFSTTSAGLLLPTLGITYILGMLIIKTLPANVQCALLCPLLCGFGLLGAGMLMCAAPCVLATPVLMFYHVPSQVSLEFFASMLISVLYNCKYWHFTILYWLSLKLPHSYSF